MKSFSRKEARGKLMKSRRRWNKIFLSGFQRSKKNEDGRENEEKNKKKKVRKDDGQRQNEREDERRKRKAAKRARKRSRRTELYELSECQRYTPQFLYFQLC